MTHHYTHLARTLSWCPVSVVTRTASIDPSARSGRGRHTGSHCTRRCASCE